MRSFDAIFATCEMFDSPFSLLHPARPMNSASQSPAQAQVVVAVPCDEHDRADCLHTRWGMEAVMGCVYRQMAKHGLMPLRRFIGYSGKEQWMYAVVDAMRAQEVLEQLERDVERQPVVLFVQDVNAQVLQVLHDLQVPPHRVER